MGSACGHRECYAGQREKLATVPNTITAVRTMGSLLLVALAVTDDSQAFLVAAIAVYWVGDIADGLVARRTNTETRTGAVLDILCDRLGCATCYFAFAIFHPDMWPAIIIFLLQFMVIDNYLSLAFQRWPLSSPNYFYLIDPVIWRLNWSAPAKMTNSAALLFAMVLADDAVLPTMLALAVGVVKVWSVLRVLQLPHDASIKCAKSRSPGRLISSAD